MYTDIEDVPREKVATQWDMGWFCDDCESLQSWKKKAYKIGYKTLCRNCAERRIANATNKTQYHCKTL